MQYKQRFLFLTLLTSLHFFSAPIFAAEEIDSVAIIVNENIITKQQITTRFNDFKRQLSLQGKKLPPENLLKNQVIERIIVDNIQMQMAKAKGIHIDDLSLNNALESIAQNNSTTLDNMHNLLESKGISYNSFREQTRKDMTIRQLQQRMIFSRVKVSEQEIDIFLEQQKASGDAANDKYHLAHILIATPEAASPEDVAKALAKANEALAKLKEGEAFNEVALRYSDGRHALKGGDLGLLGAAQLPSLFLDAARRLKIDEVSTALRSAGGFHILKLLDKKTQTHIVSQTHARHILIKADEITSSEDARKKLTEVKLKLDQGEDFAKLAAKYSQDPGSKNKGGDLGWASEGTFVLRFNEVMNSLKDGQTSEPFKSQFGWHIMQVLERRKQDETEQVIRQKAQRAIQNRKADEELQLWLRRARDEAYVEYRIKAENL
ncbi:Periplasmic chaperone and peptidyl-prolyl cis-trans isomerase of outer membrane proteins SurA [hydrothermal vent metagenome]|uniref:Periplasmic chaperone and peptidyl-prolyl cis-trans isomerase of outer membrane proteins SurA n=1 Tax=hydrothermal vent metagenome TaxID=652676 RepID=A0A3B0XGR4_9ZZZZ